MYTASFHKERLSDLPEKNQKKFSASSGCGCVRLSLEPFAEFASTRKVDVQCVGEGANKRVNARHSAERTMHGACAKEREDWPSERVARCVLSSRSGF